MNAIDQILQLAKHRQSIAGKECAECIALFDENHNLFALNLRWKLGAEAIECWHLATEWNITLCGANIAEK
jgi:hypothetical protein